jgi:Putative DNA-binding domain
MVCVPADFTMPDGYCRHMPVQLARLANLLGATANRATFEQIATLIGKKVREDTDLDFKQANTYISGGDGAEELAKDVTGMANAQGGLIIVGIEEDEQACARRPTPVTITGKVTEQMEQILRTRVVPWLNGTDIRPVECPDTPGTGFYLISVPRSPLAPHAVRSPGPSRPRYAYAHRAGITTRWLEETEIANAYRDRFKLAQDHAAQAQALFENSPFPPMNQVSATDTWLELALIPSIGARHQLSTAFISEVQRFLATFSESAPVPGLAGGRFPTVARRRIHFDGGTCLLDFGTDGSTFIQAHAAWRPTHDPQVAPVLWVAFLEYQVLGAVHLGTAYARWAGAYGDADILAKTAGEPTVYLETGPMGRAGTSVPSTATRTSDAPTHITVPLDAIAEDDRELHLAARSIATDLLADYGQADTRLLKPDGSIAYGLLDHGYQGPLQNWLDNTAR